jgi:phosphocarrier protein HPr
MGTSATQSEGSTTPLESDLTVVNRMGIHARPATRIVELTNTFKARIHFVKDGEEVDGKSIFGVMCLAATQGTVLKVRAWGEDARDLLSALSALFQSGFGEMGPEGASGVPEARG